MKISLIGSKNYLSIWGALLLISSVFIGCNSDESDKKETEEKEEICDNTVIEGYRTITQDGATRAYILHIPASYNENTPTPLILNFHGFGGCAADFLANIGDLNQVADNNNFIVAYPQGIIRSKEGTEWDPGDSGVQNINDNDVYFVEQLIADISSDYNIETSQIYATGYSNGGMMAYGLACNQSNRIAAVGIMSGVMLPGSCDLDEYTSIIHFHGIADDVLPFDGNQHFQSITDGINFWLNHNNILPTSLITTTLNNDDVIKEQYDGGSGNTSVVLYTINREYGKEGGHVWFTANIDGVQPNQILWDFLSTYTLND